MAPPAKQPANDGDANDEGTAAHASDLPPAATGSPAKPARVSHKQRFYSRGSVSLSSPSPALLSLYTLCIQYLGINSAFVISVLGRDAVVGFGEERRKMAHASFWTGDASETLIDSPLSLSTMWITGFFTFIYLRFFCYCDFFKFFFFLSLFLSWDHRGNTAMNEAMDHFYRVCKGRLLRTGGR